MKHNFQNKLVQKYENLCLYEYMQTYTYIYIYIYSTYVCKLMCIYTCVYKHTCVYRYIYIYIFYIHTHTYMYGVPTTSRTSTRNAMRPLFASVTETKNLFWSCRALHSALISSLSCLPWLFASWFLICCYVLFLHLHWFSLACWPFLVSGLAPLPLALG